MIYSPRPFEKLLTAFIARQTKIIELMINQFINEATMQTERVNPSKTEDFYFSNYQALSNQIDKMLRGLSKRITKTIQAGSEWSWGLANEKNDNLLSKVLDSIGRDRVPQMIIDRWSQKNLSALKAFEDRRIGGMHLSDKVWNYTKNLKGDLELALDIGIGEGASADRLSRMVRGFLQEPDRLYRRVRDEKGVLRLSKSASNYHPGQGVYRSAYKNAKRLTATETNMAYRRSDNERMNQMPFILGYEVHLSNNHTCLDSQGVPRPFFDICDILQGKYPTWFVFVGWHPLCYDDASEVYTSSGWKLFADVKDDDLILTLNPDSRGLEWSAFKYGVKSWYEGKMIHFHNRSYEQLVTPDHEVLALDKNSTEPIFIRRTAQNCGKSQPIYRSSEWVGKHIDSVCIGNEIVPYDLFAEFMGYWLSDGSLGHKWEIGIAQQDEPREAIYSCIQKMGYIPRYNCGKVEFNNKDWYIYLQQFGKCADKFVPAEIKEAEPAQIQVFLDAFISCDGYIKKPRSFVGNRGGICNPTEGERVYFTSSKRMADELGELILKIGRRPSFKIASKAGTVSEFKNGVYATNYDCWTISECRSKTATQYNKEEIDYNGWVYDLVLEKNATMYIRRNGKCFWGSNCRCYVTTILPDKREMIKYLLAMDDNGNSTYRFENKITQMPKQFNEWVEANRDRIADAQGRGRLPYFLKENERAWKGLIKEDIDADFEKALGIKKGRPMTYSEADTGRENPHYERGVNNGYNKNCQTCTVTHELRRRGFDVEAVPNVNGSVWEYLKKQDVNFYRKYTNPNGSVVRWSWSGPWRADKGYKAMSYKRALEFAEENTAEVGRYEIVVDWRTGNSAHVFMAERREDGSLLYFDPQTHQEGVETYFKNADLQRIGILRVDNKKVSDKIVKLFVKAGK